MVQCECTAFSAGLWKHQAPSHEAIEKGRRAPEHTKEFTEHDRRNSL